MQDVASLVPKERKKIDWPFIQSLYLRGLTPKAIEQQTGVKAQHVSVTANRRGWRKTLNRACVVVSKVNEEIGCIHQTSKPSEASALARNGLASELSRAIETLSSTEPRKALKTQKQRAEVLSTLANAGKVIHAWSEGEGPAVRIGLMAQVTISPAQDQTPGRQPGDIDVPAQPDQPSRS